MDSYVLTVALNAAVDTTYLMDGFSLGGVHTCRAVLRTAGGKANNVARVLRSLGMETVATGFTGGLAGCSIEESLDSLGIRCDFEPCPEETAPAAHGGSGRRRCEPSIP